MSPEEIRRNKSSFVTIINVLSSEDFTERAEVAVVVVFLLAVVSVAQHYHLS